MSDPPENAPPSKKLPEEFAPTGKKLSRFRIQPAPPVKPRLFPDELRFAARLSLLAGAAELAAWAALGRALVERREPPRTALLWAALGVGVLRAARPLWGWLGTRAPRTVIAGALLAAALALDGVWIGMPDRTGLVPLWLVLLALALPAVADLAASAMADAITVDRRQAAYSALDMGQGLGLAAGLAVGASSPRALFVLLPALALVVGALALPDLRDRGTPRSTWPLEHRLRAGRGVPTALWLALATGALSAAALSLSAGVSLAGKALPFVGATIWLVAPLAGMAIFAQLEARLPDRSLALRLCAALAVAAFVAAPLGPDGLGGLLALVALGGAAAALPATVLREAAEMDRPAASSLAWTALSLGAGLGALIALR